MKDNYYLGAGTVQPYISCRSHYFMYFFGPVTYEKEKPIISESLRERIQPILKKINNGEITEDELKTILDKIWI